MYFLMLTSLVFAGVPDRVVADYNLGNGVVKRLAISGDGSLVAGIEQGAHVGFVLSTEDWALTEIAPCTVKAVALAPGNDSNTEVFLGCEDSSVHVMEWDGEELIPKTDSGSGDDVVIDLGLGMVKAMFFHETSQSVYVVSEDGAADFLRVSTITVDDLSLNVASGYPVQLAYGSFQDAAMSETALFVAHGNDDISSLVPGSSVATINLIPTISMTIEGLAPSLNGAYCADSGGRLAEYYPSSQQFSVLMSDLGSLSSVAVSYEVDNEWLMLGADNVKIYDMSPSGGIDTEVTQRVSIDQNVKSLLVGQDGYHYAGGGQGGLYVMSANPWVSITDTAPERAADDDLVTLSFSVDTESEYEVRLGGDRSGNGIWLAEGVAGADETVDVSFSVDGNWTEGANAVYVLATDNQQRTGHAKTTVTVDNPPATPLLTSSSLGFADSALILGFDGIQDSDLDYYNVYVSTSKFSPSDWSTGGPEFDGQDGLSTPVRVESDPGSSVSVRIEPLTNGQEYYVAVRAYDEGGLEGPMSEVISGSPRPAYSAAELANERGGVACASVGGASLATIVATGLLGLIRRRRAPIILGCLIGAMFSTDALAQSRDDRGDQTPTRANMEIRYGSLFLADPNIRAVYGGQIKTESTNPVGTGNGVLQIEFGPQLFRVLELDLGVGFFQALSNTIDSDGEPSSENTMLTWYPLALDGTLRAQFFDEQLIVPYARYGYDYIIWNEKWDDGNEGKNKISGAKTGSHYGYGVSILLDAFARSRASLLEAQTGINDTFFTVEWRRQAVDSGTGLVFSGESITAGLKLDF